MTVRANPATTGGASTKSMATNVHVSRATQVSTGVEFTGAGGWSPERWEGQVGQVAGRSTPAEQWCQIAYVEWGG